MVNVDMSGKRGRKMKGLFIPGVTTEEFRKGCLEGVEALMTEGTKFGK